MYLTAWTRPNDLVLVPDHGGYYMLGKRRRIELTSFEAHPAREELVRRAIPEISGAIIPVGLRAGVFGDVVNSFQERKARRVLIGSFEVYAVPLGQTHDEPWRFISGMFKTDFAQWPEADGGSVWKVHPSQRRGEAAIIERTERLSGRATLRGRIQAADARCPGVEISAEISSQSGRHHSARLFQPLQGKQFSIPLAGMPGDRLTVRLLSVDPGTDDVDYCWLFIEDVHTSEGP
jgi:hypothetical protein